MFSSQQPRPRESRKTESVWNSSDIAREALTVIRLAKERAAPAATLRARARILYLAAQTLSLAKLYPIDAPLDQIFGVPEEEEAGRESEEQMSKETT